MASYTHVWITKDIHVQSDHKVETLKQTRMSWFEKKRLKRINLEEQLFLLLWQIEYCFGILSLSTKSKSSLGVHFACRSVRLYSKYSIAKFLLQSREGLAPSSKINPVSHLYMYACPNLEACNSVDVVFCCVTYWFFFQYFAHQKGTYISKLNYFKYVIFGDFIANFTVLDLLIVVFQTVTLCLVVFNVCVIWSQDLFYDRKIFQ